MNYCIHCIYFGTGLNIPLTVFATTIAGAYLKPDFSEKSTVRSAYDTAIAYLGFRISGGRTVIQIN